MFYYVMPDPPTTTILGPFSSEDERDECLKESGGEYNVVMQVDPKTGEIDAESVEVEQHSPSVKEMIEKHLCPYLEGVEARENGELIEDNPYIKESDYYQVWEAGYKDTETSSNEDYDDDDPNTNFN